MLRFFCSTLYLSISRWNVHIIAAGHCFLLWFYSICSGLLVFMHAIVYHAFNVCLRHKHTLTVIVRLQPICLGFFHSEYYPIMYAQIEKKVYELHYQIVSSFVLFVVNSLFLSLSLTRRSLRFSKNAIDLRNICNWVASSKLLLVACLTLLSSDFSDFYSNEMKMRRNKYPKKVQTESKTRKIV